MRYFKETCQHVISVIENRSTNVVFVVVSFGLCSLLYLWIRKKTLPKFQENVARITNIYLYPIKSVPGVEVDSAFITPTGGLVYKDVLRDR